MTSREAGSEEIKRGCGRIGTAEVEMDVGARRGKFQGESGHHHHIVAGSSNNYRGC